MNRFIINEQVLCVDDSGGGGRLFQDHLYIIRSVASFACPTRGVPDICSKCAANGTDQYIHKAWDPVNKKLINGIFACRFAHLFGSNV